MTICKGERNVSPMFVAQSVSNLALLCVVINHAEVMCPCSPSLLFITNKLHDSSASISNCTQ
jgi:hypothetical protein